MLNNKKLLTAECVTEGHPDKIADQISDTILDAALLGDINSRVACETLITKGLVLIAGEITTECYIPIDQLTRNTIRNIGYDHDATGFNCNTCAILTTIDQQSSDIAHSVDTGGAGDQGLMFGYATTETSEFMPAAYSFARALSFKISELRKSKQIDWLRPDGKTQVTVESDGEKINRIHSIIVSTQHAEYVKNNEIKERIIQEAIYTTIPNEYLDKKTILHINPSGRFVIGGPTGDTGLTGRKIIADSYGGTSRHGGGAFSGKDPSKVDRSASYMARYIAKNIVAAGLAKKCEVQLTYAIGVAEPISITLETFNTNTIDNNKIIKAVKAIFDCTPKAMIKTLDLYKPIYHSTASYGHFGRDKFNWERIDKTNDLLNILT